MVLRKVVAYLYPGCSRSSAGDVPAGERAYGAGHRADAETVRVHKEAVVKAYDHRVVLPDKHLVGDPNRMDVGHVVGSRAAAAAAAGDRAEAGGAGIAAIGGEEVVDNPMREEVPAEVVQEGGNTWGEREAALEEFAIGIQTKMDDVMTEAGVFFQSDGY